METSDAQGVILDSCVWIAYLHAEDSQHAKAVKVVGDIREAVIVPAEVLYEVATTLKNKRREEDAIAFVRETIGEVGTLLVSDEPAVREAAEAFMSGRGDRLSFTDTALRLLSRRFRVVTFDRRLEKEIERARLIT